jgi:perosamine synthetase
MVVTSDPDLHKRLRELKDQGRAKTGSGGDDLHPVVGYNFKFTNLQAAVGLAQLPLAAARVARQRAIQRLYERELSGVRGITVLPFTSEETPQWTDVLVDDRDRVAGELRERGIDSRNFWFPLHTQEPYRAPAEGFPNATWGSARALWLPSALSLSDDDVLEVCGAIQEAVTSGVG